MADMPRPREKYLHKFWTRHRKLIWYVRKPGQRRIRIRGEYGSPEFQAQYDAAISGQAKTQGRPRAAGGSVRWLWERYKETDSWQRLKPATRRQRENIMVGVLNTIGDDPCNGITKADVIASRDARGSTPAQARNFLDCLRGVFRWGLEAQHIATDPTEGVKNPRRPKTGGHKVWSEEEVDRYYAKWPLGTKERVWMDTVLYSGLRRGDAALLGPQHVKNGFFSLNTEKSGEMVAICNPVLPVLAATWKAGPIADMAFICGGNGARITKETFGNYFRRACNEAGLSGRSAHGLRKVAATRAAENGATEHQLMALFGWTDPATAAIYTKAANRKRMAKDAGATMQRDPICQPKRKVGTRGEK